MNKVKKSFAPGKYLKSSAPLGLVHLPGAFLLRGPLPEKFISELAIKSLQPVGVAICRKAFIAWVVFSDREGWIGRFLKDGGVEFRRTMFLTDLHSTHSKKMIDQSMQYAAPQFRQTNSSRWPAWIPFMGGGLITLGVIYFGVARPAADELASLKAQMSALEQSIAMVAGHKGSVDETNHLLSLLGQQQAYASSARKTLSEIQKLNAELIGEAKNVNDAAIAVDQLAAIKDQAINNADRMDEANKALNDSEDLQDRLADSVETAEMALRASIDLLAIRGELLQDSYLNESAKHALNRLVEIRATLDQEAINVEAAQERVSELIALKDEVVAGTTDLKSSIETLQITKELRDQFVEASQSFKEIRSWMMEVSAMQPIYSKVQVAMQPLTELANLEKMAPQRLREFAKWFVQQNNNTRLASIPTSSNDAGGEKDVAEGTNKIE